MAPQPIEEEVEEEVNGELEESVEEETDNPEEYQKFRKSLTEFAEQRGITVDFNVRVAGRDIDLYRLYNIVTSRGGYDSVSGEKLAWRRIGGDFHLGLTNAAAYAFALKTVYYKNLAAYEIKYMHNKEPPPVEILENLTAKGGDILSRNIETFKPPALRTGLLNGTSDSEGEDAKTPGKDDKMDIDDPASGSGRSTRGLRQQPPQRVLFQPDVSSSRNVRHSSGHAQSPQPTSGPATHTGYNYSNPNSSFFSITNYEPRPQIPMTLRPITTPGNNYPAFTAQLKRARDQKRALLGITSPHAQGMMKPGAGFEGPNIYVRTLQGLRSLVSEEQDYALHHLVKISHERGDKYKFEAFPGLAEGLIEYVLQVSSLFYDIQWHVSYTEDEHEIYTLDGINGTPDILQRIQCLKRIDLSDDLQDSERSRKLTKILEACLTIRNLSLLEENARYLSDMPQLRDFLSIALNLPDIPQVTELKHYALDVSEQVTRCWKMDPSDPLYISLLAQIDDGRDRGAILTSLRALSRISLNLEEPNLLQDVPTSTLRKICEWMILDDEDLVAACLDFLHQYTAVPANLANMLSHPVDLPLIPLLGQLTRLLQYRATPYLVKEQLTKAIKPKPAEDIPKVPADLFEQFVKHEEPDRSNNWLRSVFEEDSESSITQLTLWQAYQNLFTEYVTQNPQSGLLPAAEFIKNVSAIFATANAQVVQGAVTKFIIKGIRPRHAPVDAKGRTYSRCLWKETSHKQCGEFQLKPRHMFEHVAVAHLGMKRRADGNWNFESSSLAYHPQDCYWGNCRHFSKTGHDAPSLYDLGRHVKTHLPDTSGKASTRLKYNRTLANKTRTPGFLDADALDYDPEHGSEATFKETWFQDTAKDDRGVATGLSLTSGLLLRNIARNIPRAVNLMDGTDKDRLRKQLMEQLLAPSKDRLLFSMAHNRPLGPLMADIVAWIERGTK